MRARSGPFASQRSDWPEGEYKIAKRRLALFLVSAAGSGGRRRLGRLLLKERLARMHPRVRTAERVFLEETGQVSGTTDASNAFRTTGQTSESLYAEATAHRGIGLPRRGLARRIRRTRRGRQSSYVLSVRRRRTEYEADPASCFACGRCYAVLPEASVSGGRRRGSNRQGVDDAGNGTNSLGMMQASLPDGAEHGCCRAVFSAIFTVSLVAEPHRQRHPRAVAREQTGGA